MSDTKVIGYLAMKSRSELFCDGEALIIAGSHAAMKRMLATTGIAAVSSYTIKKAKFGEVVSGMERGGVYDLDAESYARFLPLARTIGLPCGDFDFTPSTPGEIKMVTLSLPSIK